MTEWELLIGHFRLCV